MKKWRLFLAMLMAVAFMPRAWADWSGTYEDTSSGITYKLYLGNAGSNQEKYAWVKYIETTATDFTIPGTVTYNGVTYNVVGFIADNLERFHCECPNLKYLRIPDSHLPSASSSWERYIGLVEGYFDGMPLLKEIWFNADAWALDRSIGGVYQFASTFTVYLSSGASGWLGADCVEHVYQIPDYTDGGIGYQLSNGHATVVKFDTGSRVNITIPASITLNGNTYPVEYFGGGADFWFSNAATSWIKTLTFEDDIQFQRADLQELNNLEKVVFNGDASFYGSTSSIRGPQLKEVEFHGEVSYLSSTLYGPTLRKVYFFDQLPDIDNNSFYDKSLITAYVNMTAAEIQEFKHGSGAYDWEDIDMRPINASPVGDVIAGSVSDWLDHLLPSQILDCNRIRVIGYQGSYDLAAMKELCDGTRASIKALDLSEATFPSTLQLSFAGFSTLDTLYLPSAAITLANNCFQGCKSTLVVVANRTTPYATASENSFGSAGSDVAAMTLIVPGGSYSTYSNTKPWSYFGTKDAIGGEGTASAWASFIFRSTGPGSFAAALQSMGDGEQRTLKNLTITGKLNSADLREIRRLCGAPFSWQGTAPEPTGYNVHYLDLSRAEFVSDNNPFMQRTFGGNTTNYTINSSSPMYGYAYLTQVDTIWLPTSGLISYWDFNQSNPNMVVYTLKNVSQFGTANPEWANCTLYVPKGRTEYYSNYGFGTVIDGGYEGIGTIPAPKPDSITYNIYRGDAGARVYLEYYTMVGDQVVQRVDTIRSGASMRKILRTDVYRTSSGTVSYTTPSLKMVVINSSNRSFSAYSNTCYIGDSYPSTVEGTDSLLYEFGCFPNEQVSGGHNGIYELNISLQFGDAVVTDSRILNLKCNSIDPRGTHVYIFDKDSDGSPINNTKEEVGMFSMIPEDKYVEIDFYFLNGTPTFEGNRKLYVNGEDKTQSLHQMFDYTYQGNTYYRYDIPNLKLYQLWDIDCTVKRSGEPDPDKVTHYVTLTDHSGKASATFAYDNEEGETIRADINSFGYSETFEMPKLFDRNGFVEITVKVPEGYKPNIYGSRYEYLPQPDEEKETIDGVVYTNYRWSTTNYDNRMVNQTFHIEVSEPDPTVDWNVTLLNGATAEMSFSLENGTDLEGGITATESGIVKANAKAKQMRLFIFYEGEDLNNVQPVVKADGKDFSNMFMRDGDDQGFCLKNEDIPVDPLSTTNWIIGVKNPNSQNVVWSLQAKGEVPEGCSATIQAVGVTTAWVINDQTTASSQAFTSDQLSGSVSGSIQVAPGYEYKITFNGQTLPSSLRDGSSFTIADMAALTPYLTDGTWVIEFFEKPVEIIAFADSNVEAICVENWDTDHDGKLSKTEAAVVTTLIDSGTNKSVFNSKTGITSFDELQYFTGLTSIEEKAFEGCVTLASIKLPENITQLNPRSFWSCNSLKHIQLPNGLETLSDRALAKSGLTSIFIPKSVMSIGYGVFEDCKQLQSIVVEEGNEKYSSPNGCNAIVCNYDFLGVPIPSLLAGCKNTTIPEDVCWILKSAFSGQGELTKIVIPSKVYNIGQYAFYGCGKLTSIVMERTEPFDYPPSLLIGVGTDAFKNISSECVLTVPHGTRQDYLDAGWSESIFKGGIEETPLNCDVNGDGQVSISDAVIIVDEILNK